MRDSARLGGVDLGPYVVLDMLSGDSRRGLARVQGSTGEVLVARWCEHADDEGAHRLRREYEALTEIADVGVPRPVALYRTSSHIVALREYVIGASLSACTPTNRAEWCEHLAALVMRVGQLSWVHGDISPKNIIVTADGQPVLVDWELAARPGEEGAPGTLGYAPPGAWDVDRPATPHSDLYAAAVVVIETLTSTRLFCGTRDTVFRLQSETDLAAPGSAGVRVRALFSALRGENAPRPEIRLDLTRIDPERVAWRAVREIVRRVAIGAADGDALTHGRDEISEESGAIRLPVGLFSEAAAMRALCHEWMLSGRGPAVSRRDVTRRAARGAQIGQEIEGLRAARGFEAALAAVIPADQTLLVVDDSRNDGPGTRTLVQGCDSASGDLASVQSTARVRVVRCVGQWEREQSARDARSTLVVAAGEAVGTTLPLNLDFRREWSFDDTLKALSGETVPVQASAGLAGYEAEDCSAATYIGRAEELVVAGRLHEAYRWCVRAYSLQLEAGQSEDRLTARVAQLWRELGMPQAALSALERISDLGVRRELELAHAATSDRLSEIEPILERYKEDLPIRERALRARAAATRLFLRQGPKAAYQMLRGLPLRTYRGSPRDLANHCFVLLSAARGIDRAGTATRLHRLAAAAAARAASPRATLLASYAGLLSRPGVLGNPGSREYQALGSVARRFGFWRDARKMQLRMARALVDEGEFERALACVGALGADESSDGCTGGELFGTARRVAWSAADALERWHSAALGAALCDEDVADAQELLHAEATGEWRLSAFSPRGIVGRCARLLLRNPDRSCSASRALRVISYAQEMRSDLRGVGVSLARAWFSCECRSSSSGGLVAAAIEKARATGVDSDRALAIGLMVLSVVRGVASSATDVEWAAEQRGAFAGGRPPGVRRWEWTLGAHAIEARSTGTSVSRAILDAVEAQLQEMTRELPHRVRARYSGRALLVWRSPEAERTQPTIADPREGSGTPGSRIASLARRAKSEPSLDEALSTCVRLAVEVSGSERGVAIFDRGDGRPRAKVFGSVRAASTSDIEVCHSVLSRAEELGTVVVVDDAVGDPTLSDRPSVKRFQARSVAVVPLAYNHRRLGYLYLETRSTSRTLGQQEVAELAMAGEELAAFLELASYRDEVAALRRDREQLLSQVGRSGELERLGRNVGEVVHELKNVLTVVIGEAELAAQGSSSEPEMKSAFEIVRKQALQGSRVIGRLLGLLRGRVDSGRTEIDVRAMAEEVMFALRSRVVDVRKRGVDIAVRLDAPRSVRVVGVESELREVLSNLIVNALEAMPKGGVLEVRALEDSEGRAIVEVRDTGIGMSEEVLGRIFDPFFSTKGAGGNGMGLSICRAIAERHGGTLSVQSAVGVGTSFTLRIPRNLPSASAESLLGALRTPRV